MKPSGWIALGSGLAVASGGAVAATATWVAWRARFHPPLAGATAALASLYGATGGPAGYRGAEAWASGGLQVAAVGALGVLLVLAARAARARWYRFTGWLFALLLGLGSLGAFGAAAGVGLASAFERCSAHPSLPGCRSDRPRGPDPAVTKTEPEWLAAVGGASLVVLGVGALAGAVVAGGAWVVGLGLALRGEERG